MIYSLKMQDSYTSPSCPKVMNPPIFNTSCTIQDFFASVNDNDTFDDNNLLGHNNEPFDHDNKVTSNASNSNKAETSVQPSAYTTDTDQHDIL